MSDFGRLLTAMVTPMKENGDVDYEGAARLALHLCESGSEGLVISGTTGESPVLTEDEKVKLFKTVVDEVGKKAFIFAGTCSYCTAESISLTKRAEKSGVNGILAVAPYYNKPPQEGLYRHFKAVAESTSLPVMLYNIPGRTGVNMKPETVARLAQIKNIAALKEAAGDMEQLVQMVTVTPREFLVYSGDDCLTLPFLSGGAYGVVSVAGHLVGREIKDMIDLFFKGKPAEALEVHQRLLPLFKALFITTNPIPVKYALKLMGLPSGRTRLPLCDPTESEQEKIKETLKGYGLI
ncbi:MAG: 4-hydroxy-tetrahydrodipicolinate synthase [Bacillota bacterium]